MHLYERSQRIYQREESLSQVEQVEVFDASLLASADHEDAQYVSMQRMHQPVSLAEVLPRIIERRVENV